MSIQIIKRKRRVSEIILVFFLMVSTVNSFAQKVLKEIPAYPFLNTSINKISYPDDEKVLNSFYKKIDALIKYDVGKVNIVHIGGSHIQADIYSHQLRKNLLSLKPNMVGERGLIFPFTAAETNNPKNYQTTFKGVWETTKNTFQELKQPLGINGIAVTTVDSIAEISIRLRNEEDPKMHFKRVRIIGTNHNYSLKIFTDSLHSFDGKYDKTSSSYLFDLKESHESFTLRLISMDSIRSFTLQGILLENDESGLTYHAIGVNGASVPSFLKCEFFERDLKLLKPDLVILSLGINDAVADDFDVEKYKSNYTKLIQKIHSVASNTPILFTTNNDSYRKINKEFCLNTNGLLVRDALFELAKTQHAAVWDLFNIMGGLESMKEWETAELGSNDRVHFKKEGYIILGDLLYNALIFDYFYNFN